MFPNRFSPFECFFFMTELTCRTKTRHKRFFLHGEVAGKCLELSTLLYSYPHFVVFLLFFIHRITMYHWFMKSIGLFDALQLLTEPQCKSLQNFLRATSKFCSCRACRVMTCTAMPCANTFMKFRSFGANSLRAPSTLPSTSWPARGMSRNIQSVKNLLARANTTHLHQVASSICGNFFRNGSSSTPLWSPSLQNESVAIMKGRTSCRVTPLSASCLISAPLPS